MAAGIEALRADVEIASALVVHAGSVRLPLVPGIQAVPFSDL